MQSFVEVIRLGSFSEAAKTLGLSRPLVSRHVTDLERHLGVRLLTRTTRRITLTEAGMKYFEFCQRVIREIEQSEGYAQDSCAEVVYYVDARRRHRQLRDGESLSQRQFDAR